VVWVGILMRRFITLQEVRVSKVAIMLSDRSAKAAARRLTAWNTGAKVSCIQWVVGFCSSSDW